MKETKFDVVALKAVFLCVCAAAFFAAQTRPEVGVVTERPAAGSVIERGGDLFRPL